MCPLLSRQNESQMFETAERGEKTRQPRQARQILSQPRSVEEGPMLLDQGPTFLERGRWREDQISRSLDKIKGRQPSNPISNIVLVGWMHFWPPWSWTQVRCLLGHVLPLVMSFMEHQRRCLAKTSHCAISSNIDLTITPWLISSQSVPGVRSYCRVWDTLGHCPNAGTEWVSHHSSFRFNAAISAYLVR